MLNYYMYEAHLMEEEGWGFFCYVMVSVCMAPRSSQWVLSTRSALGGEHSNYTDNHLYKYRLLVYSEHGLLQYWDQYNSSFRVTLVSHLQRVWSRVYNFKSRESEIRISSYLTIIMPDRIPVISELLLGVFHMLLTVCNQSTQTQGWTM